MTIPVWPIKLGEMPTVIDLSDNNAEFRTQDEFHALYAAGIRLVIHKAGQFGEAKGDPLYAIRRPLTLAAGLKWDAYWFCTSAPIAEQMAKFLAFAEPDMSMRLALDAEPNHGATIIPVDAATFALNMDQKLGRQVLRYGGESLTTFRQPGWIKGPQWWAKYGPEPTIELMKSLGVPPENIVLWQETGSGREAGHGPVDLSYARNDVSTWPALTGF